MKKIITYKKFNESVSPDTKKDIEEIFYDLTDYGKFKIQIEQTSNSIKHSKLAIQKYRGEVPFYFDEIKECVFRLKDYFSNKSENKHHNKIVQVFYFQLNTQGTRVIPMSKFLDLENDLYIDDDVYHYRMFEFCIIFEDE